MCGIAGIWNIGADREPIDRSILERMVALLRHRGPDDSGLYVSREVGLGHARLSIVDLSGGHQPMSNEDGSVWVVFNGEIYNHPDLRKQLIAKGHTFKTHSDTEVIVHLYEEVGEECVNQFNGQFAFAIWDAGTRQLFLARDRMGVRPLFYARKNDHFVFGSEMKALFADRAFPRQIDLQALDQAFTFWFPLPPRSGFAGINELPPGHTMRVTASGSRISRYWSLSYPTLEESTGAMPHSERWYADTLLELLDDAVNIRLRADVPVGAYLSGGLDSSIVTTLALRHINERLKTFSIGFEEADFDETLHQRRLVEHLHTEHHPFLCKNAQVGDGFEKAVWYMERPVVRTAPVPMMLLSHGVRQAGIKVVLTGEGADEILAGYDIFKEAKIRRFWAASPGSRLRPFLLRRLYPYMPSLQGQSLGYITAFFGQGLTDTDDPFYSHRLRWQVTSSLKRFYSKATKEALRNYDPVEELRAGLPAEFSRWHPLSKAQYLEAAHLLPGYILSSQGERMGMANSVEGRFPFLDHRVVEFAATIPPQLKLRCLKEKHILREAVRGILPDASRERIKQPYRAPDHASLFEKECRARYAEALSPPRVSDAGVFSSKAVGSLVTKAKRQETFGTKDGMALVGLLSVQLLFDQFVRSAGVPSSAGSVMHNAS
jgi:asparagine synthase (glutamine-hydrolysing)